MMKRFADMFDKARKLESLIASRVEGSAERVVRAPADRHPLEVLQAVVDAIAAEVQPAGRGSRLLPFNHARVTLLTPSDRVRAQFQALLDGPEPLRKRVDQRLASAGCAAGPLDIQVAFATKVREDWTARDFNVHLSRVDAPAAPSHRLELVVTAGNAGRPSYAFTSVVVTIGRSADVCDARGRLIRTNDVAFADDGDEINQTVSRLHARIECEPDAGTWRLFDEGSAQGTHIIRGGRGHAVPRGTRGLMLEAGDDIMVGRARLRVKGLR
jgi:hypothetical protein